MSATKLEIDLEKDMPPAAAEVLRAEAVKRRIPLKDLMREVLIRTAEQLAGPEPKKAA